MESIHLSSTSAIIGKHFTFNFAYKSTSLLNKIIKIESLSTAFPSQENDKHFHILCYTC